MKKCLPGRTFMELFLLNSWTLKYFITHNILVCSIHIVVGVLWSSWNIWHLTFFLWKIWVTAFEVCLVSVFISYGTKEFAKLRVLRAYVPYVPLRLTCLRVFVPQINTCLRSYVPLFFTCLRALIFHVLTCLQPLTKYIEAHFYTLHCCFSLDYLQKQPPEVFFKKRCS